MLIIVVPYVIHCTIVDVSLICSRPFNFTHIQNINVHSFHFFKNVIQLSCSKKGNLITCNFSIFNSIDRNDGYTIICYLEVGVNFKIGCHQLSSEDRRTICVVYFILRAAPYDLDL